MPENETVELKTAYAFIEGFPENAIDMELNVRIYENGEVVQYRMRYNAPELAGLIEDTKDGYMPGLKNIAWDEVDDYIEPWAGLVVELPIESIEAEILAHIYECGKVVLFTKRLSIIELREAFRNAEENFISPNAVFVLTDEGRAYAEELLKTAETGGDDGS